MYTHKTSFYRLNQVEIARTVGNSCMISTIYSVYNA